jgi:hypothetical protein
MRIHDFVVGEDIRVEMGNKHSVMGIFGDYLSVTLPATAGDAPISLRLAFLVRLEVGPDDPDTLHFEFRISSQEKDVARFDGATGKPRQFKGLLALPLIANVIQVPVTSGANELRFRFTVRDTGGKEIFSDTLRSTTLFVSKSSESQPGAPGPGPTAH